jgi:glycosyltransferase involved in cell wall biosynthesis
MTKNRLISIIIPVYNVEKYLHECVDSVLHQTYRNLEVILVDDGSSDRCPQICDEYAEKDIRIKVIHKRNSGQSDARNAGFEIATGDYVYFLDSDDYLAETAMEELYDAAEKVQADFVLFGAACIFENETVRQIYSKNDMMCKQQYGTDQGYKVLDRLIRSNEYHSSVPLTFIRSEYLQKHGLQFFRGIIHEDELYVFLLFWYASKVAHLHKPLYFRRVRANSTMTAQKSASNYEGYYTVYRELLKIYENGEFDRERQLLLKRCLSRLCIATVNVFHALSLAERNKVKEDQRKFCKTMKAERYFGSMKARVICNCYFVYKCLRWCVRLCRKMRRRGVVLCQI